MKGTISFIFNLFLLGTIISFVVTCYFPSSEDQTKPEYNLVKKDTPKLVHNPAHGARPFNRNNPKWIKEPGYKESFRDHPECIRNMQERTHNFLKSWYQEEIRTENFWKIESYKSQSNAVSDYWMEISCSGNIYKEAFHELRVRN